MFASKSLREYNNNQEKIKQLFLEEKTRAKKTTIIDTSTQLINNENSNCRQRSVKPRTFSLNRKEQPESPTTEKNNTTKTQNYNQQATTKTTTITRKMKEKQMAQKETKSKDIGQRKHNQNPNETFLSKSRAAALQQTKLHMEKQDNRSLIRINEEELSKSPTIEVITLTASIRKQVSKPRRAKI